MASTYKVVDAVDIVKETQPRGKENMHTAADLALRYLWRAYTWRETLAELPPFVLIPERQDYGAPWSVVPTDFDSLRKAWLCYAPADGSGIWRREIDVKAEVEFANNRGNMWPADVITYDRARRLFRLSSPVPAATSSPENFVQGEYKIKPTKITGANLNSTTFPLDDDLFPLFVECVRWKTFQLTGDQRAGSIQVFSDGRRQYSGQAVVVNDLLTQSIVDEEEGRGPSQLSPEFSLTDW